jgi:hypothetical protein
MKAISFLGFFALAAAFVSCNKPAESIPNTTIDPQNVKIELYTCAELTGSNSPSRICFDSVTDSRCPLTMECFWAGEVTVTLSLKAKDQKRSFQLSTLNAPPYKRQDTTISGNHFKLISVTPYPGDGSQNPYKLELSINQ